VSRSLELLFFEFLCLMLFNEQDCYLIFLKSSTTTEDEAFDSQIFAAYSHGPMKIVGEVYPMPS